MQDQEKLALDNCDKEPIHIPGTIQPFGYLLVCDKNLDRFLYASENVEALDLVAVNLFDRDPISILGAEMVHEIRNHLSSSLSSMQRIHCGCFHLADLQLDVYAHLNCDGLAVIELEPDESPNDDVNFEQLRFVLSNAARQTSITQLLNIAASGLRQFSGYDRVKSYRYLPNGDGEILAESKIAQAPSFMGLRYPAWDVPQQARALLIKNPVRILSDVRQEPIKILCANAELGDVDQSLAQLRGISPIHTEYLRNMGVDATLKIGIIIEGKLWGMFACHHMSPRVLPASQRAFCELFGQMISLTIQQMLASESAMAKSRGETARQNLLDNFDPQISLFDSMSSISASIFEAVPCDGMSIYHEEEICDFGDVPDFEFTKFLIEFAAQSDAAVTVITSFKSDLPDTPSRPEIPDGFAGAIVVNSALSNDAHLVFFRRSIQHTLKWAGRPEKELKTGPNGPRLTPRGSFDAYIEKSGDSCKEWSEADIAAAESLQLLLVQLSSKADELRNAELKQMVLHQRQKDLLIAELNHRVKNILALIKSLSRRAKQSSHSIESYAAALEQRIAALATAHDITINEAQSGVSINALLRSELAPYIQDDAAQALMTGPDIGVRADAAPMMSLIFHELSTNAAKYGAFSTEDGILRLRWSLEQDHLVFEWTELNGPVVKTLERKGFGYTLIEKVVPYEFDGRVDLAFPESGFRLNLELPMHLVTEAPGGKWQQDVLPVKEPVQAPATGKTALIVEDNLILALDMEESLTRLEAIGITTVGTLREARQAVSTHNYDFAVLDVNLRGQTSLEAAADLQTKEIPFLFVTGYGSSIHIPESLKRVPLLTKPVDDLTLSKTLTRLLEKLDS